MNNKKVSPGLEIKGDQSQIQSQELAEEDKEVNQIRKENQTPETPGESGKDKDQVAFIVKDNLIENPYKKPSKIRSGTASPFKDQTRPKSNLPLELEFKWKEILVTAKADKGCCTKYDPNVHKDKVN